METILCAEMSDSQVSKRRAVFYRGAFVFFVALVGTIALLEKQRLKLPGSLDQVQYENCEAYIVNTDASPSRVIDYTCVIKMAKSTLLKATEKTSFRDNFRRIPDVIPGWTSYEGLGGESVTFIEGNRHVRPVIDATSKTTVIYSRRMTSWEQFLVRLGLLKQWKG